MSIRALLESGTAPDLEVAGLRLWVHGRESPENSDFWDGNWLRATAHCSGTGAWVSVSGSFLRTDELLRWLSEIEVLQQSLTGQAQLAPIEPELRVLLQALEQGHTLSSASTSLPTSFPRSTSFASSSTSPTCPPWHLRFAGSSSGIQSPAPRRNMQGRLTPRCSGPHTGVRPCVAAELIRR